MQDQVDISIKNFYIFNPKFGEKEGEEDKKIFLYYPPKTDAITQIKTVGLSEAIIKFTQTFITKEECRSVHTLKTRQFFYQPEPHYWMVLTINLPYSKLKNDVKDAIYHSENIHDEVYLSMLKQAYEMYKLFVGPFHISMADDPLNRTNLKLKLQKFFNRYLHYMKIANCDIVDAFEGMQYLPLDKKPYLHAQSFMNRFQCIFNNQVQYSILMTKHQVVWSNIETSELRVIYRYLVTNLLSSHLDELSSKECNLSKNHIEIVLDRDMNAGRFITCPPFYSNNSTIAMTEVPKLFIRCEEKNLVYQLLVYNVLSSFMCLFIPESVEVSSDFLKTVETFLKLKLGALATELWLEGELRRSKRVNTLNTGNPFSYIYFNRLNLAQKNTLHDNKAHVTPEVLSILSDVCFDKKRNSSTGETVVKTYDDFWIVGQFCNEREFYMISQQKNTTLIEISDKMKRICDRQLKSIYFHV